MSAFSQAVIQAMRPPHVKEGRLHSGRSTFPTDKDRIYLILATSYLQFRKSDWTQQACGIICLPKTIGAALRLR
ncbi:predicted protein [Histoplasma mississippiense (nom. inval.)]|uniref:predicted protein n=1 Tax=Ajellomyces capsulatus (strain NAm1 / WU24) TaxID=2059318 RepID=UPI000157B55D|nr:predicted protein [Histoplasma mississippiense (nom. inval.)]EDN02602.1 predicted protein [Histoplasma mississippiense (nom. inval.)]